MSEADTATRVEVSDRDGKVLLHFSRPTENLVMDPDNTLMIAGAMAKAAYVCRTGKAPREGVVAGLMGSIRNQVTRERRDVLVNRVILMMNNQHTDPKTPLYWAQQIVDSVLSEAT